MPVKRRFRDFIAYSCPVTRSVLLRNLRKAQMTGMRFYKPHEKEILDLIQSIYRETDLLMQPIEAYQLYHLGKMQAKLPGDFAEIGVYRGGSAKILCETKGEKNYYGFDTFAGSPKPDFSDTTVIKEHEFPSEIDRVKKYLSSYQNVHLIKGMFPQSAGPSREKRFALVNIDADLYAGVKAGLEFFWDRMVEHGMIVVHDTHFEGTRKAIAEFLAGHPAQSFYCPGTQWVVFK